ncbi:hypothetical protein [Crossiella cryophila]|uniref:Aminoglycoside phosphotransferase domain-containing protein n=1 Tax=Crossiella cryophila TaxID=43355 RepID=A0A7W7CC07_9PSEU|nr:hypothetical protein [Crossiella cryophila]MBB4678372.1 hypothetical protein [Crossiella cryophila]
MTRRHTVVVPEYGTRWQRQLVRTGLDGGYELLRSPGPDRRIPFRAPDATLRAWLARVATPGGGLVPGRPSPAGTVYPIEHWRTAADLLLAGAAPDRAGLVGAVRETGRLLALAHRGAPPSVGVPPPAHARLTAFLRVGGRTEATRLAAATLCQGLGIPAWARLLGWCADLAADPDPVLVHGAPGLAAIVPGQRVQLLIGDDLGAAPAAFDLGWLLGELLELSHAFPGPGWPELIAALAEGYGTELDERVRRMAVLRIVLHLHDFVGYVGWHTGAVRNYVGLVADTLEGVHSGAC